MVKPCIQRQPHLHNHIRIALLVEPTPDKARNHALKNVHHPESADAHMPTNEREVFCVSKNYRTSLNKGFKGWEMILAVFFLIGLVDYAESFVTKRTAFQTSTVQPRRQGTTHLDERFTTQRIRHVLYAALRNSTTLESDLTVGNWEEIHGNFLLRPPLEDGPPRALLHFLGGALVGSAPHISYRYMLERLAAEGYLVVATPYELSFDHLTTCDDIIERFERIAAPLARTYGAVPVIGIGHSCGSLLQLLITSLFPDTPRAANVLISFNNKPISDAVPFFDEFFAPFFSFAAARNDTMRVSGSEVIRVGLELATATAVGQVPSDELIARAAKSIVPPELAKNMFPPGFGTTPIVPIAIRTGLATVATPATQAFANAGIQPILVEFLQFLQQIPKLIDEVADGARDFIPPPPHVSAATQRSYRARRTLLIKYNEDPLDESDKIEELLQAAGRVIRMKRPMVEIDVQRRNLTGGHAAPLLAPPLDLATRAETLLGPEVAKETFFYTQADETVRGIVEWLEESNL